MKVWLIQTGEPVPLTPGVKRMRTALLAGELASRDHEVVWWASAFDHGSRSFIARGGTVARISQGVEVRLLDALGYRRNLSLRRYVDHRLVASNFRKQLGAGVTQPDIVVAATPDYHIAAEAARFAFRRGIPYVIDVRDAWPDSFAEAFDNSLLQRAVRILLKKDFKKVKAMLRGAAGVVGMMESMVDWGLAHAGRKRTESDRVFYLGTEALPEPDPVFRRELSAALEGLERRPTIVYVGTFGRYNNPEVLLQAVQTLQARGEADVFNLVVAGDGDFFGAMRSQYGDLPGVHFPGWLNAAQISTVLSLGVVGVLPWTKGDAFPNKAFSYLAAGLPILTSTSGDLRRIVQEEGIGAYFQPGDAEGLADMLSGLLRDRVGLQRMSARVRELYPQRFEAATIYRWYADYLEAMGQRGDLGAAG